MEEKKRRVRIMLAVAVTITIVAAFAIYLASHKPASRAKEYGPFADFARCLTNRGVRVFGTYWCPTCNKQKHLFGRSWDLVSYVECSDPGTRSRNATCINENITAYPTWEFGDGSRYVIDKLTFEFLSEKSGCPLPQEMVRSDRQ